MTHSEARAARELLDRLSRAESDIVGLKRQLETARANEAAAEKCVDALRMDVSLCHGALDQSSARIAMLEAALGDVITIVEDPPNIDATYQVAVAVRERVRLTGVDS